MVPEMIEHVLEMSAHDLRPYGQFRIGLAFAR